MNKETILYNSRANILNNQAGQIYLQSKKRLTPNKSIEVVYAKKTLVSH